MKKKKGFSIQINFSNRWLYTFIVIGILSIIGVGVYALAPGVAPNPGHLVDNVAPPTGCTNGQVLGWDGSAWGCVDMSEILVSTLKTKVIEIGDWNMDADRFKFISEATLGITLENIRSIDILVRSDLLTSNIPFDGVNGDDGRYVVSLVNNRLELYRKTTGCFDTVDFNLASFNRGWITIRYTE